MDIWLALLPAVASILAAGFAWLQAVKTARVGVDADRRREALRVATEETREAVVALDGAWHDIQQAKDAIKDLLAEDKREFSNATRMMTEAAISLETNYRKFGSKVPDAANDAWYRARGLLGPLTATVTAQSNELFTDAEKAAIRDELIQGRLVLTEYQIILLHERQSLRDRKAAQILEIL